MNLILLFLSTALWILYFSNLNKNIIDTFDKIMFTTLSLSFLSMKYIFIFGTNSIITLAIITIYGFYLIGSKSPNAIK